MNIPHHQCDGFFNPAVSVWPEFAAKAMDPECTPAGRKSRRCYWLDCSFAHPLIIAATIGSKAAQEFAEPRALKGKMASCLEAMGTPLCVAG